MKQMLPVMLLLVSLGALVGCGEDDPEATPTNNGEANNDTTNNDTTNNDTTNNDANNGEDMVPAECILPSDYSPGADDEWPACISDDGNYNQFEPNISSAGRVAAFEEIADILWRGGTPTANDFLDAREAYQIDEGLDSRVQRREDEHYPPVTDADGNTLRCRDEGVPAMDPDRCVGPATIGPLILGSLQEGAMGTDPEVNAAKVEAALLWFLYVSTHKEATTCTVAAKDCDSSYAYYTGDMPPESAIGLAATIRASSPAANDRVWDGILAVRCWRDLDSGDTAMDLDTRDQALAQLDRALLYGLSRVIIDRAEAMTGHTGAAKAADWAWLQILGPVLDRELQERDPAAATTLAAEWEKASGDEADVTTIAMTLSEAFPCP